jgi:hypothetical protein
VPVSVPAEEQPASIAENTAILIRADNLFLITDFITVILPFFCPKRSDRSFQIIFCLGFTHRTHLQNECEAKVHFRHHCQKIFYFMPAAQKSGTA